MGNPYGGQTPPPLNAPPSAPLAPGIQPGSLAGLIIARIVQIFGSMSGLFVYNPTPGSGNLTESISALVGTDIYGNHVLPGFTVYGTLSQKITMQSGAAPAMGFISGAVTEQQPGDVNAQALNRGLANEQIVMVFSGPESTVTTLDATVIELLSSPANAANSATGQLIYFQGGNTVVAEWGRTGFTGTLTAKIASTVPASNPAVAETWHTITPAGSFTPGTPVPAYMFEAMNGGRVRFRGQVVAPTTGAGSTWFTLPAGYRPSTGPQTYLGTNNLSGTAGLGGTIQVATTGVCTIVPAATAGNVFWLDGITVELD